MAQAALAGRHRRRRASGGQASPRRGHPVHTWRVGGAARGQTAASARSLERGLPNRLGCVSHSEERQRWNVGATMFVVALIDIAGPLEQEAVMLASDLGTTMYEERLRLAAGTPAVVLATPDERRAHELLV